MAEWDAAYVNDLPDSAFLLIAPGGRKDADGNTVPRDLRYFPVRNAAGDVDLAHVRNALARIPQASSLTAAQRQAAMDKAKALAKTTSVSGDKGEYAGSAGSGRSSRAPAEMLTRTYELTLEVRSDGDGRTLVGRAVPYGQTADIPGGKEQFVMGAFARQIGAGQIGQVKLHSSHHDRLNGAMPIGKTVHLQEQPDGLHGAWRMHETPRGDEALQLVRTGEVTGLSIGFKASDGGTKKGADGTLVRTAAHLDHVVLTTEPVYQGAQVLAVRTVAHPVAAYRTDLIRARHLLDRVLSG